MKRIGKVLLLIVILLAYIGVVCFGVMLVIDDTERGTLQNLGGNVLAQGVMEQYTGFQQMADEVAEWCVQEMEQERLITDYVTEALIDMTIEQKLAQMMILTNEKDIHAANLQTYQPAGIILFQVDFSGKTMEQVSERVRTLQSYMSIPLFVGVDEEGGEVSRLKTLAETDLPEFSSARALTEQGEESIKEDTRIKMQYLKDMGLNLNFAPVADVVDQKSSYMYQRSASGNPQVASEYVTAVLEVMGEEQIMACVKHFPGYGNNVNTHDGLAHDSRSVEEYEEKDFLPFLASIEAGVDMVMVSHIIMESVDQENPSSLSPAVHNILRNDMNFDGVIIADDLNMQAILKSMTIQEATAKALVAGNDMIFSADFAASMRGALDAVQQGELTEEQVNASVERVLRMKIENGLIELEQSE